MPRPTLFSVAETKLRRVRDELGYIDRSLSAAKEAGFDDSWSRSATIAFALHGAYTGIEDAMSDIARTIDDFLPIGGMSHQALLDQMRARSTGAAPPFSTRRSFDNGLNSKDSGISSAITTESI